jgi:chromosome segregation ATPase
VANLRQAQEKRIALLTSTRADAQNYLALEEKLKQTKANLKATEQNLTKLEKDAKSQAKVLQNKQTELAQLKSNLARIQQTKKENTFTLQKELRNYKLYHAREICRLAPDLKEKVTNLKSQKAQLLTTITNLESELTQKRK